MRSIQILLRTFPLIIIFIYAGCSGGTEIQDKDLNKTDGSQSEFLWFNPDTVKAGRFDTGTMWTFEYPPLDYFSKEYNFNPDTEWFESTRMAALRFADYCSASFVSEDGLVMTNNHCARESIVEVQLEGEDLGKDGFIAAEIEDERLVPGLFVDQLVIIIDVTDEINQAVDMGTTDQEKVNNRREVIEEIEQRIADSTGLITSITALYNGGKYSLYGYKRYNNVKLVFSPETQLGYFGGDPDNFTYPRYNLDCTFFRVYDDSGAPLKVNYFYKWSSESISEGEPVFVVGNPASTDRLKTVAQLEFSRDIQYPRHVELLTDLRDIYGILLTQEPENKDELQNDYYSYSNSLKAVSGMLDGLRDPVLMARKKDFEKQFRNKVLSDPDLKKLYGSMWEDIETSRSRVSEFSNELYILNPNPLNSSDYFFIASEAVDLAMELKLPEEQRSEAYQDLNTEEFVDFIFPEDINEDLQRMILERQIKRMYNLVGHDYPLLQKMTGGKTGKEAVDFMFSKSFVTSKEKLAEIINKGADEILNSDDPFIYYVIHSEERRNELLTISRELGAREAVLNQLLGRALYDVYGTSIPPDATFTLRISDGIVKGFPYNGTIAPPITTFYGMYDRYYSFNKEFPFNLPDRWLSPPAEFDLSTPFNFVSTNDIIGGNSGSAVINMKGEVVGLAFDGNIRSLPGSFIFAPEENRTVSVHSEGMIEAIRDLYKMTRLSEELINGRIVN